MAVSVDASMEDRNAGPRVLFCAFAEVPGPTAVGVRMAQLLAGFGKGIAMDGLSLKGDDLSHIERLGAARMMRVPVAGKTFLEKLAAYQRALNRQIAADTYRVVWCGDLFSAAVAAELKQKKGFSLFVEAADVPSSSFAARWPVDADDEALQRKWREAERAVFKAATRVIAPSRHAGKLMAERIDPLAVLLVPRAIDHKALAPPSIQVDLDPRASVVVFGGREGGGRARAVVSALAALAERLPADRLRLAVLGRPGPKDSDLIGALEDAGLDDRVDLIDGTTPVQVATALQAARVVVVPSSAEDDVEPCALPHRALEALACGRAVVVTGPETPFKDGLQNGEHGVVVSARDPGVVVDAVMALLEDPYRRDALGRAGQQRVVESFDLATRLQEVAKLLGDHLNVAIETRGADDHVSSSATGLPTIGPAQSARTAFVAPAAVPTSEPGSGRVARVTSQATDEEGRPAAMPTPMPPPDAMRPSEFDPSTGPLMAARGGDPLPTILTERPNLSDLDVGDLDPEGGHDHTQLDAFSSRNIPDPISNADPTRVAARMLVTGDPPGSGGGHAASSTGARVPTQPDVSEAKTSAAPGPPGLTSLRIALSQHTDDGVSARSQPEVKLDPWAPDTIADGTPIADQTSSSEEASSEDAAALSPAARAAREPTKSFLVEPELVDPEEPTGKIARPPGRKKSDEGSAGA